MKEMDFDIDWRVACAQSQRCESGVFSSDGTVGCLQSSVFG